jgi:hypothetical protein
MRPNNLSSVLPPKLFISYARRDFPFVRDLVQTLRAAGMELWLDVASIDVAADWANSIESALAACTHVLVVLSPYSMKSTAVAQEIELALKNSKPIIPILLQTTMNLPRTLQRIQWVDFRINYGKAVQSLLDRLRGHVHSAVDLWLDTPPHRSHIRNFIPLLYIIMPKPVKAIAAAIFLNGAFKLLLGYCATQYDADDGVVFGYMLIFLTTFGMWWDYRSAVRRVTKGEMICLQVFSCVILTFCCFAADPHLYFLLLGVPADLVLGLLILTSKTYRRWMIAYPFGGGWTD